MNDATGLSAEVGVCGAVVDSARAVSAVVVAGALGFFEVLVAPVVAAGWLETRNFGLGGKGA